MGSSEQTVLPSAVSWMSTAMATKWHRPADCSTREPRPPETRGLRLLTGASQARLVCSLIPSVDTAGRRGPPHTGGRWRGTTEPGRWGSGKRELPYPHTILFSELHTEHGWKFICCLAWNVAARKKHGEKIDINTDGVGVFTIVLFSKCRVSTIDDLHPGVTLRNKPCFPLVSGTLQA